MRYPAVGGRHDVQARLAFDSCTDSSGVGPAPHFEVRYLGAQAWGRREVSVEDSREETQLLLLSKPLQLEGFAQLLQRMGLHVMKADVRPLSSCCGIGWGVGNSTLAARRRGNPPRLGDQSNVGVMGGTLLGSRLLVSGSMRIAQLCCMEL